MHQVLDIAVSIVHISATCLPFSLLADLLLLKQSSGTFPCNRKYFKCRPPLAGGDATLHLVTVDMRLRRQCRKIKVTSFSSVDTAFKINNLPKNYKLLATCTSYVKASAIKKKIENVFWFDCSVFFGPGNDIMWSVLLLFVQHADLTGSSYFENSFANSGYCLD